MPDRCGTARRWHHPGRPGPAAGPFGHRPGAWRAARCQGEQGPRQPAGQHDRQRQRPGADARDLEPNRALFTDDLKPAPVDPALTGEHDQQRALAIDGQRRMLERLAAEVVGDRFARKLGPRAPALREPAVQVVGIDRDRPRFGPTHLVDRGRKGLLEARGTCIGLGRMRERPRAQPCLGLHLRQADGTKAAREHHHPCRHEQQAAAARGPAHAPRHRVTMTVSFCPPKPNELLRQVSTLAARAVLGT